MSHSTTTIDKARIAQLAEHFICNEDVIGSIPFLGSISNGDQPWILNDTNFEVTMNDDLCYEIQIHQGDMWDSWDTADWVDDPLPYLKKRLIELRKEFPKSEYRLVSVVTTYTVIED